MTLVDATPALDAAVAAVIDDGTLGTAVTVVAESPSGTISKAYGVRHDRQPAAPTDVSNLYCATKPALGVAFLTLVQEGRADLDASVDSVLDWMGDSWIGKLSFLDILTQNTNLHRLGAVIPLAADPSKRAGLLKSLPELELEGTRGYADFGGWFLLAHAVEQIAGTDFRDFAYQRAIAPYGIDERDFNLGIHEDLFDQYLPYLSLNLYSREGSGLHPLAAEGARIWACGWNPPSASYGSAVGLAKFYRGVLEDARGAGVVLGPELAARAVHGGERFFDHRLKYEARFGLGFMVDMGTFNCGPAPSEHSFGHAGMGGGSIGFADSDHDVAVGLIVNAVFDETRALLNHREHLVSAIYADLGLVREAA